MRHHPHTTWGLGHTSHPEDPQSCCSFPEGHPVHRPRYWREGDPVTFAADGSDA